jgi:hypothetical protein
LCLAILSAFITGLRSLKKIYPQKNTGNVARATAAKTGK